MIKSIGKSQSHQILNSLLAEIMINPENLVFLEVLADDFYVPISGAGESRIGEEVSA